jgi:hypothetical protein
MKTGPLIGLWNERICPESHRRSAKDRGPANTCYARIFALGYTPLDATPIVRSLIS